MNRNDLIRRLRAVEPALRAQGVAGLYLYGSYARGDARPDSDIDLFVDKAPGHRYGFDELMGGYRAVSNALPGHDVSFGTRDGLSGYVRASVEREAIRIF